jgi:AbrB family looped-hinge helix DNA binding protein
MVTATLTSKGQITIPKHVRDSLRLQTGDRIEFLVRESEAVMRPVTKSVDEVFGRLHDPKQAIKTVAEMKAAVDAHVKRRNR